MTYLLSGLSKNNQTIETVRSFFEKQKLKPQPEIQMGSEFKNKLFGELKRRFDSGTRAVVNGVNKAIGKGGNPQ